MKRFRCLAVFCAVLICCGILGATVMQVPVLAATVQQTERYSPYRTTQKISYYSAPKAAAKVVGTLSKGKTIAVVKGSKQQVGAMTWYQVRIGSKRYYVKNAGIKKIAVARPSVNGTLRVKGTKLVDKNGETVQLRGISTHGIAWFPQYINASCFRQLSQDWNVNCIRLAVYTEEYGGYCSGGDQKALEDLIVKGVKYAKQQNLYVIVDWHVLSDGNPNAHLKEAKQFFKRISARLKGYNNVLYEICNEPNGGTTWQQIRSYANKIIPVIRKNAPNSVIIVGTPTWSQGVEEAAKTPLKQKNLLYALHFYAATHKSELRNSMIRANKAGLPIFVSEFGISEASGNGTVDTAEANRWVTAMEQRGIGYMMWNLSNKDEASSLLKSSCTKTANFFGSDLSASGKWLYRLLTGLSAPSASGSSDTATGGSATSNSQPTQTVTGSTGKVTHQATLVNQWTSGDTTFYQYTLKVSNSSNQSVDWTVSLSFNSAIALQSSWNGNFTVKGKTLRITGVDYNNTVAAGATISDMGFIVSGGKLSK